MTLKITIKTALATACVAGAMLSASTVPAAGADDAIYTGLFSNVAVSGYDPVSYFVQGKPLKGSKAFTATHEDATWRFSSQENLEAFLANPQAYAPQYGGYCAWAVSQGYTASANPKNWAIEDGKLYLNYNEDVQQTWNKDRAGFISLANENWPSVLK